MSGMRFFTMMNSDMIVDNLSLSQLHSSMCEEEHIPDGSIDAGVPSAALDMIEAMNFSD